MKFAICNETFNDRSIPAGFEFARKCGYTGIEIAPFTIATYASDITQSQRAEVRQWAKDTDIQVIGLHWLLAKTEGFYLTTSDKSVRQQTSEYLSQLARLCCDLGGSLMVLGSPKQRNLLPGISHDQALNYAADCIQMMAPTLEECNVTIALEPLGPGEGDFMNHASDGVELMRRIGSPNVRLHLDVKAMSTEPTPIPDIIRQNAKQMHHFHANDPNLKGPGFGDVDFLPIFQALLDVDYKDWVSVEVFDYTPGVEKLAVDSMRYMKECLAKLGQKV